MINAKIVNVKKASVRKNIMDPNETKDVLGELSIGDELEINDKVRYYDWTDKEFYACHCQYGDGYIRTELVDPVKRH